MNNTVKTITLVFSLVSPLSSHSVNDQPSLQVTQEKMFRFLTKYDRPIYFNKVNSLKGIIQTLLNQSKTYSWRPITSWEQITNNLKNQEERDNLQIAAEQLLQISCQELKNILSETFGRNDIAIFTSLWKNHFHENLWDKLSTKDLENIRILDLSNQQLTHLPNMLNKTPFLVQLNLDNNNLTDIVGLPRLNRLIGLSLNNNRITSLAGMPTLDRLHLIGINNNRIQKLELPTLTFLELFFANNNTINSLKGFSQQPSLKVFSLNCNYLSSVENFPSLPKLLTLGLDENELTSLAGLPEQPQLQQLFASKNRIETLEGLSSHKNLTKINLSNNKIRKIDPLYLPRLESLNLAMNEIGSLSDLSLLTRLTFGHGISLNITGNNLDQSSRKEFIKGYGKVLVIG